MKKLIALTLALVLSLLVFTSCGTYNGIDKPDTPTGGDTPTPETPVTPETPDVPKDDTPFVVTIIYDNAPYVDTDGMYAMWTRDGEIHRAPFVYDEKTGISTASITGLDGDYAVTLLNLSTKYMYDANAYVATSNNRNTVIELFRFYKNSTKPGDDPYSAHTISRVGAYTAQITEKQPFMFYQFTPTSEGTYTITTICDINANEVNPSFEIYSGNIGSWYYHHTIESGATEASYTRNVKYEVSLHKENIGQSFMFKVTANHKNGVYPINVSFLVRYEAPDTSRDDYGIKTNKLTITNTDGKFVISSGDAVNAELLADSTLYNDKMQSPTELIGDMTLRRGEAELLKLKFTKISTDGDATSGDFVGSLYVEETGIDIGVGGTYVYVISKESGEITLYLSVTKRYADEEALAKIGEIYGPEGSIQYPEVFVSAGVYRFDGTMFGLNPDDGFYHLYNQASGKYDGPILYAKIKKESRFFGKYYPIGSTIPYEIAFVGGYATSNPSETIGVVNIEAPGNKMLHSLSDGTEDYSAFIESYGAYVHQDTNPEGVYPVTEELKEFLQKFAISGRYFMDGNGWAETTAEDELGYRIYSSEEDQWLFACCYFI